MYILVIKNTIKENGINDYVEVSKKMAEDTKKIEGCIDSIVCIDTVEKNCVVNIEMWTSKEAFEKYDGSAFLKYKVELKKNFMGNTTSIFETV